MRTSRSIIAGLVLAAGVSACATPAAPPPARLAFDRQNCAAAPDLSTAISLTPDKERAVHLVTAAVSEDGACLMRAGAPTPYLVFALPADFEDKTLIVGGALEAQRIFAPRVEVLNAEGLRVRDFPRDAYFYRGPVYSVQFRARPGDSYVLVTAAEDLVGQNYDAIQIGVATSVVTTGLVTTTIRTGVESQSVRTFSYDGVVRVTVNDTDTEEKAAGS